MNKALLTDTWIFVLTMGLYSLFDLIYEFITGYEPEPFSWFSVVSVIIVVMVWWFILPLFEKSDD